MSKFRSFVWDPILILSQILCLQCVMYSTFQLLLLIVSHLPTPATLGFLHYEDVSLHLLFGFFVYDMNGQEHTYLYVDKGNDRKHMIWWITSCLFLLNSLIGSIWLLLIVRRAKQCLDFTVTFHVLHLVLATIYSHFPWSFSWYLINGVSLIFMSVLGEYLCMKNELSAIPIVGAKLGQL